MPRTQRNGKNAEDGKPQRTAEGKQKIRHEDLAEPPRIYRGRVQDGEGPLYLKAGRQRSMALRSLSRTPPQSKSRGAAAEKGFVAADTA